MTTEDAPTPTPPPPGAPGSTGGDLTALQAAIDKQAQAAARDAQLAKAKAAGFDSIEAHEADIAAALAAREEAKTADEKRADELTRRENEAAAAQAAAKAATARATVTAALLRAGVAPDAADRLVPLVQITGDITDDTAKTAVEALKADATFAPLFTPPAPAGPASGVTGQPPAKGAGMTPQTEDELVKQLLDERHPVQTA